MRDRIDLPENAYSIKERVRLSEVGPAGDMRLPMVINYFQDCSTFQSEALGLGIEHCKEQNRAWILSSWQIEVERLPKLGDQIKVSTWASGFNRFLGERNFAMQDEDGNTLACAHSLWVFMDTKKGRMIPFKDEDVLPYGLGAPIENLENSRKVLMPEGGVKGTPFPVRREQIDTNQHVNNCQYVQMALEVLPEELDIRGIRVSYKQSATYGVYIYPEIVKEENGYVVALNNEAGEHYSIVELRS